MHEDVEVLLVDDADGDGLLVGQRDDGEVKSDDPAEELAEDQLREVREAHLPAELELARVMVERPDALAALCGERRDVEGEEDDAIARRAVEGKAF